MEKLKLLLENENTGFGKIFSLFIQALIVISLISFAVETVPNLSETTLAVLFVLEIVIVTIFSIEYLLRVIIAEKKLKFIFSFYGMIDLLAILPFYISTGIDLRSIRIFRLLRLFRILKLFRYSDAIKKLQMAFKMVKTEFQLFILSTLFIIYLSSVGIYYFESEAQPDVFSSVFDCMWWSVATLTTVGYGDAYPITVGGKIFASVIVFVGVGIVAVPTGLLASSLTQMVKNNNVSK